MIVLSMNWLMTVTSTFRADNWKVSNGADTPVANGLTDFGKVGLWWCFAQIIPSSLSYG